MRLQNLAIKCTCHIIPTIDDTIVDFNGARVFSKLNLSRGYHQMLLSPKSRNVSTFTTHAARFGINSPAEIFKNVIQNALSSLEGVRNM